MAPESADERVENASAARSPKTVDRILVGVCGAIWLVFLAAAAVAAVALVRLAGGHPSGGERNPSWLLYSVIVVSALIIVAAIPLLLRARRNALADRSEEVAVVTTEVRSPALPAEAPTEKMRVFGVDPYAQRPAVAGPAPRIPAAVLDRLWLRGTTSLLSAMGLALIAVAVATSLLAASNDTGAWVALALAGVVTIAMPAVLVFHQRILGEAMEEAGE